MHNPAALPAINDRQFIYLSFIIYSYVLSKEDLKKKTSSALQKSDAWVFLICIIIFNLIGIKMEQVKSIGNRNYERSNTVIGGVNFLIWSASCVTIMPPLDL